jgi:hypothetical protein
MVSKIKEAEGTERVLAPRMQNVGWECSPGVRKTAPAVFLTPGYSYLTPSGLFLEARPEMSTGHFSIRAKFLFALHEC